MKRSMLVLLMAAAVSLALATSVRAQSAPVTAGALCSPEGATGTTADGTQMLCTRASGEDQPHWRAATTSQQTSPTQPPVATTAPSSVAATTTPTVASTAMPNTGSASGDSALIGFAAVLGGLLAVWWGRPRLAALIARPRVIEQERIDRAAPLLGWSDPWENHLDKPHWLRHEED
jgi:hypothetical protein